MNRLFRLSPQTKDKKNLNDNSNHDNKHVTNADIINKLQSMLNETPLVENDLSQFSDLIITGFNWRNATNDEIERLKNTILDLITVDGSVTNHLLHKFIGQFRSSDMEHLKVDICGRTFESILVLKKHIRNILMESVDDVDLDGEDYELLFELLNYHPRLGDFREKVVSIFPSTHKSPKFNGLRCFFYRMVDGSCEYFSYARCSDNVKTRGEIFREHICNLIIEIYSLFPNTLSTITDIIESSYPHHNVSIDHHVSVTKAILYLSRHISPTRSTLYRILINRLTIIDAEIKLEDPNSIDIEKVENLRSQKLKELADQLRKGDTDIHEAKSQLENPNWFKNMYEKLRTEEDIDDMSQKLDVLMGIVFGELQYILRKNEDTPAPTRDAGQCFDSSDDEEFAARREFIGSCVLEEVNNNIFGEVKVKREQLPNLKLESTYPVDYKLQGSHYSVSDVIFLELIDTFEDIILPTYNCKYVQFIYFFISSLNEQWCRLFLQRLFEILYDDNEHVIKRRTAASYISSLVCRSKFVSNKMVCSAVDYLCRLISTFDVILACPLKSESSTCTNGSTPRRGVKLKSKLSLLYSLLQNILYICCYRLDALSDSPYSVYFLQDYERGFIAHLDSYLSPLYYFKNSIISKAIQVTRNNEKFQKLHNFLKSKASQFLSQEIDSPLYSPIDSFFPFDPYLLHHSNYYIRDKYRHLPSSDSGNLCKDLINLKLDVNIKKEVNEVALDILVKNEDGISTEACESPRSHLLVDAVLDAIKDDCEIDSETLMAMSKQVRDSLGFASIPRIVKARLEKEKRRASQDTLSDIEADYDFWGETEQLSRKARRKRRNKTQDITSNTSPLKPRHIVLEIDQIDDLQLSLPSSLFLRLGGKKRSTLLDMLTSSAAYKSATTNSARL